MGEVINQKGRVDIFGSPFLKNKTVKLSERFEYPPFTILNAREGSWQARKRLWLRLGIESELGRGEGNKIAPGGSPMVTGYSQDGKRLVDPTYGKKRGKKAETFNSKGPGNLRKKFRAIPGGGSGSNSVYMFRKGDGKYESAKQAGGEEPSGGTGTSIFDPVLCELIYKWFCPKGGQIVDAFAGGSVRGIVAGLLGFRYWGADLRGEQIAANEAQRATIAPTAPVQWRCGDCRKELGKAPEADLLFTCPPYGNLEQYSDDPTDLSSMEYPKFIEALDDVIQKAAKRLKPNRFACMVVGDFRDRKTGFYNSFIGDVIACHQGAGLGLYNEIILITAVGSLPLRVVAQFDKSRKMGKTHQNVLVFLKGDAKTATSFINQEASRG